MSELKNKIKMIGCGGAGIHVTSYVASKINSIGTGFAPIECHYVDTSKTTFDYVKAPGSKHVIERVTHGAAAIDGSGGDRQTNVKDIIPGAQKFLDDSDILKHETGTYCVVAFAASSGSGSVIGPMVIKNLMERDIPVIAVVIGDSTNTLGGINTLNTLSGLHKIAVKTKTALTTLYVNNETYIEEGIHQAISQSNESIYNAMAGISLFLSGDNHSLDNQDMINIIDQTKIKTLKLPAGMYALNIFSKTVTVSDNCIATVGRTLTTQDISPDIGVGLEHHKVGYVVDQNAIDAVRDLFPIHMVTQANFFTLEQARLDKYVKDQKAKLATLSIAPIDGDEDAEEDESGLVM